MLAHDRLELVGRLTTRRLVPRPAGVVLGEVRDRGLIVLARVLGDLGLLGASPPLPGAGASCFASVGGGAAALQQAPELNQ